MSASAYADWVLYLLDLFLDTQGYVEFADWILDKADQYPNGYGSFEDFYSVISLHPFYSEMEY